MSNSVLMIRKLVIPLMIVSAVLAIVSLSNRHYSGDYRSRIACMNGIYANHEGPAHVLLIGSSRSQAGLINGYIRLRMQKSESRLKTVDSILIGGSDQISKAGVAAQYLKSLGAPEVLLLENMFVQKGPELLNQYKTVPFIDPTPSTIRYTDWRNYGRVQSEMLDIEGSKLLDYLDARHLNRYEFLSTQLSYSFYELLKNPNMIKTPLLKACTNNNDHRGPGDPFKSGLSGPKHLAKSVIGSWEKRHSLDDAKPYSEKKKKKITAEVNEYIPLRANDENRDFDLTAMKQIIKMFEDAGTKKILVWVPGDYLMRYDEDLHEFLEEQYGPYGASKVYFDEILNLYDASDRDKIFRNGNHVNMPGKVILSDFWVRELEQID